MGKTRDLFKKIRDTNKTFHAKMGSIKDRNGLDLTEAECIKKRSLIFPILFFSSISLHSSLTKAFLSLLASLWNSTFRCIYLSFSPLLFTSLLITAICKASSDSHFAFLYFFPMDMVLIPVSCTRSQTSFHSSSGTLSIRSRPLNLFLTSTV